MGEPIKKITDLTIGQSFMQVNLVQGYKYIDRAGEIVNNFYHNKKAPAFNMDLNGLVIFSPEDKAQQFKVSPNAIWAFFLKPDSMEYMDSFFVKKAESVAKILDVKEVNRIGWRHYFIHEFKDEAQRDACFKKLTSFENTSVEGITLRSEMQKVSLTIRLKQIVKKEDKPFPGILIDVDLFREYGDNLSVSKISSAFSDFKKVVRSDDFLALVNKIISG